jgi:uncharacterized protein (DUF1330 family)
VRVENKASAVKKEDSLTAYCIFHIEVTDPRKYRDYAAAVPETIAKYGGEYLVRGGEFEVLEGSAPAPRTVVLKFPSVEQARRWYHSVEYHAPRAIRQSAARTDAIVIDGV